MTAAQPQPGAIDAVRGRHRFSRCLGLFLIALSIAPLTGCLIPLASDLGMAHSYLNHHHVFKPVVSELPMADEPVAEMKQPNHKS